MICNIIDRRKKEYCWKRINVVVEPTWHDNTCPNADQAEEIEGGLEYDARESVTLSEAIQWASSYSEPVTLYLYDEGEGTR